MLVPAGAARYVPRGGLDADRVGSGADGPWSPATATMREAARLLTLAWLQTLSG
jgi:hypothetical protein